MVRKNIYGWKKRDGGFQGGGYSIALDKREISLDLIKEVALNLKRVGMKDSLNRLLTPLFLLMILL